MITSAGVEIKAGDSYCTSTIVAANKRAKLCSYLGGSGDRATKRKKLTFSFVGSSQRCGVLDRYRLSQRRRSADGKKKTRDNKREREPPFPLSLAAAFSWLLGLVVSSRFSPFLPFVFFCL